MSSKGSRSVMGRTREGGMWVHTQRRALTRRLVIFTKKDEEAIVGMIKSDQAQLVMKNSVRLETWVVFYRLRLFLVVYDRPKERLRTVLRSDQSEYRSPLIPVFRETIEELDRISQFDARTRLSLEWQGDLACFFDCHQLSLEGKCLVRELFIRASDRGVYPWLRDKAIGEAWRLFWANQPAEIRGSVLGMTPEQKRISCDAVAFALQHMGIANGTEVKK